ncbi:MAG: response regulator, partial [Ferruginibacter sp.]
MKQEAALILLVDDDDDDCEIIQKGFAKNGIANEFRCFPNGLEALQFLKNTSSQIFLILSDVNMPLMNGLEFKKAINNDT